LAIASAAADEAIDGEALEIGQLFDSGGCAELVLEALKGRVWSFARHCVGTRVLQAAIERASVRELRGILSEIHGHVQEACCCPNANYVLQKAIEVSPAPLNAFVAAELRDTAREVARDRMGCRVIQRLLEHNSADAIVPELLQDISGLSSHRYGRHVIVAVCEHGSPRQQSEVARALSAHRAADLACSRNASYVVEAALRASGEGGAGLKGALLGEASRLAFTPAGHFVLAAMLESGQGDVHAAMARSLSSQRHMLRQSRAGVLVERALF
jgi:hypothetical protein